MCLADSCFIAALGVDSQAADLPDVCRYFWGSVGDALSVFFSVVVLLGGIVVYWVLMSNFLYYTGNVIHGKNASSFLEKRYFLIG